MVKTVGFNAENKHLIKYPKIRSAIHPVAHSLEIPTQSTSFTSENMDQDMEIDVYLPFDNQTKSWSHHRHYPLSIKLSLMI